MSTTNTWTRNHYLLLDHHYTRAVHASSTRLPDAYMASWDSIPEGLRKCLGMKLVTPVVGAVNGGVEVGERRKERNEGRGEDEKFKATVSESWIRIAFCFVEEAGRKGVPLLCDSTFTSTHTSTHIHTTTSSTQKSQPEDELFPVRDPETGRVRRVKQEYWSSEQGALEVVRRVYSLWVRDRMAGR